MCIRDRLFGDGTQSRDFTYVGDIAEGTARAIETNLKGFHIVNLGGGGDRTTILDFIQLIGRLSGQEARIEFKPAVQADMKHTSACIDKAFAQLRWQPQTSVEDGMANLVKWHLANRGLLIDMPF